MRKADFFHRMAFAAGKLMAPGVDPIVIMAATGLSQEQLQQFAVQKSA